MRTMFIPPSAYIAVSYTHLFTYINSILSKSKKLISYYPSLLVASVLRQQQAHSKEQQCFHQSLSLIHI